MSSRVDTIITAAGLSSRMNGWKLKLPLSDSTVIEKSVENALDFSDRVILVLGYRGNELRELFRDNKNVVMAENLGYINGIYSSIQTGVRLVESDYFFISHGDLPLITSEIYTHLWKQRGCKCIIPQHNGVRGHPVLLPKTVVPQILKGSYSSMKELLLTLPHSFIPIDSEFIYMDIDREEDYSKICDLYY